jgi:hypothetical protein
MWTSIISYIAGYILLGMVISFMPETGEKLSRWNYALVCMFWPFVLVWFFSLIIYATIEWIIKKIKVKTSNI